MTNLEIGNSIKRTYIYRLQVRASPTTLKHHVGSRRGTGMYIPSPSFRPPPSPPLYTVCKLYVYCTGVGAKEKEREINAQIVLSVSNKFNVHISTTILNLSACVCCHFSLSGKARTKNTARPQMTHHRGQQRTVGGSTFVRRGGKRIAASITWRVSFTVIMSFCW